MMKNILIVGGSSGLGLELATHYANAGHAVTITGRKDPQRADLRFLSFPIESDGTHLSARVEALAAQLPVVNTLIYAAGYYQEGRIDSLSHEDVLQMIHVGLTMPTLLVRRLKNNPGKPLKVMLITSTSQFTPRELESIYTATKAGLGMFADSLALDPEIGKVLVVAPAGMKTPFWSGQDRDVSEMLDPKWVAAQTVELSSGPFKYKFAKILRNPARVEVVAVR